MKAFYGKNDAFFRKWNNLGVHFFEYYGIVIMNLYRYNRRNL